MTLMTNLFLCIIAKKQYLCKKSNSKNSTQTDETRNDVTENNSIFKNLDPSRTIDVFSLLYSDTFINGYVEIKNSLGKITEKIALSTCKDLDKISNRTLEKFPNGVYTITVKENNKTVHQTKIYKS